ncbi:Transposase and inactivated derivatives, TnpA family [Serratia odorifera]|uniref:Uncharacterized protein n=2 Tax=Serratia odorifera TaxID=618 RepID=D4E9X6_SEROD|nr:hypothetical protein HMPREF0758_4976 [Serratia odorifera DSM 4582]VDZ51319.1 Transposase and inactivated derivatives, TnpA family [Serratia odorifera]
MSSEREKRGQLAPLYQVARQLLPGLGVSQQNLLYFASLANFYTIHDLRNLRKEQTWLYLLCYIWLRYYMDWKILGLLRASPNRAL